MASPLTPRTIHPSSLPDEPHAERPADLLRPSPQRSLVDRVLERLEPHLPTGLRAGDPSTHRSAEAFPDDDTDDPLGPLPTGGRGRLVARVLVVAVTAAVAWWLLRPPPPPVEAVLPLAGQTAPADGAPTASATATTGDPGAASNGGGPANPGVTVTPPPAGDGDRAETASALVVQAAGAVVHPGVYRLPAGSRVDDVVRAAGGVRLDADLDRVNLAAPVHDGERVWVPRVGEEVAPPVVAGGGAAPVAPSGSGGGAGGTASPGAPAAPVDLNTATAEELDTLPGVGPVTAAAIVAHRDENGPFGSVDALLDVRGIGEAKLEQLRPLVRV